MSVIKNLLAITIVFTALGLGSCFAQSTTAPSTVPTTKPSASHWRLVISRQDIGEGEEARTIFIATVINVGKFEQVLYTPGLSWPVLLPKPEWGDEPLAAHCTPRRGRESVKDFVTLNPGEGFSRTTHTPLFRAVGLDKVSSINAYLLVYEPGFEGVSGHVAEVVNSNVLPVTEFKQ